MHVLRCGAMLLGLYWYRHLLCIAELCCPLFSLRHLVLCIVHHAISNVTRSSYILRFCFHCVILCFALCIMRLVSSLPTYYILRLVSCLCSCTDMCFVSWLTIATHCLLHTPLCFLIVSCAVMLLISWLIICCMLRFLITSCNADNLLNTNCNAKNLLMLKVHHQLVEALELLVYHLRYLDTDLQFQTFWDTYLDWIA